jgi:hypothetical protein
LIRPHLDGRVGLAVGGYDDRAALFDQTDRGGLAVLEELHIGSGALRCFAVPKHARGHAAGIQVNEGHSCDKRKAGSNSQDEPACIQDNCLPLCEVPEAKRRMQ